MTKEIDAPSSNKVLCPVCRCLTPRSLLADNHFVKAVEDDKNDIKKIEVKKICGSCEDEEVDGAEYCTECAEWLCAECVKAHKRVKLTKNHTLRELFIPLRQETNTLFDLFS